MVLKCTLNVIKIVTSFNSATKDNTAIESYVTVII